MGIHSSTIKYLPSAVAADLARWLADARPAVPPDHDRTLTASVARPQKRLRSAGERRRRDMITYHSL